MLEGSQTIHLGEYCHRDLLYDTPMALKRELVAEKSSAGEGSLFSCDNELV